MEIFVQEEKKLGVEQGGLDFYQWLVRQWGGAVLETTCQNAGRLPATTDERSFTS